MKPIQTTLRTSSTKFDIPSSLTIPANKQRFVPRSGSYPKGFRVGSIKAGIKPASNSQPDLVLVTSEIPASGAAVFTKNEFPAASVTVSRELLRRTKGEGFRGAIANSGCANTLTGLDGLNDARAMSREAERCICGGGGRGEDDDASSSSIMVMHTGIGSQRLPITNILQNIPSLYKDTGNTHTHWLNAARGLCTTDTFPKLTSRTFTLPSFPDTLFSIAGLTKGSGMVHPNMATTLGIICTDAPITPTALQSLLSTAVDKSYNCLSIDGDTSTNDMVVMFANGAAVPIPSATSNISDSNSNEKPIDISQPQSADFLVLQEILTSLTTSMSHLVVRDAEGASKFITVRIRNSPSHTAGKYIASSIARSSLIKTAFYGEDPTTWAGVLATLGHSLLDTEFEGRGIIVPEMTSIWFVDSDGDTEGKVLKVLDKGVPGHVDEERIKNVMAREDLEVVVDLRDGGNVEGDREGDEAVYWTSDLTHEFVSINSGVAR